jgi:hypothetical protein
MRRVKGELSKVLAEAEHVTVLPAASGTCAMLCARWRMDVSNGKAEVVRVGSRHRNDSQLRSVTSSAKQTSDRADTAIAHHAPP